MVKIAQDKRVVIIGAGIGGLTTAIGLRRKLGFENFTVSTFCTYQFNNTLNATSRSSKRQMM